MILILNMFFTFFFFTSLWFCMFFYSICTLVLCQFLPNSQLSSMHQILLWGGAVVVNLQIILVGSNPSHIICISLPWGTSLPHPQIPPPHHYHQVFNVQWVRKPMAKPETLQVLI